MVPMSPTPGGQTEHNSAGQGMAPPVRVELPNPGAPSFKLKLSVLPLRRRDLAQAQASKTPQLCGDQGLCSGHQPLQSPHQETPPKVNHHEGWGRAEAWGCARAQKGLQGQGLECLELRGTWAPGPP